MASLNTSILDEALKDGLISPIENKPYLHSSVLTANAILASLHAAAELGLDVEQISKSISLSRNTILQFTRWMERNNLVEVLPDGYKNLYKVK